MIFQIFDAVMADIRPPLTESTGTQVGLGLIHGFPVLRRHLRSEVNRSNSRRRAIAESEVYVVRRSLIIVFCKQSFLMTTAITVAFF